MPFLQDVEQMGPPLLLQVHRSEIIPEAGRGGPAMTALQRLWKHSKVDGDCWRFLGSRTKNGGHGLIRYQLRIVYVHRLSAHLHLGFSLDSSLQINHKQECRFPDCWNPIHLYAGTQTDNMKDAAPNISRSSVNGAKDTCPNGHEYTLLNTYRHRGKRYCRACNRLSKTKG